MELQFRKTGIPCLKDILREPKNQEQTQELRLPEAYPDVGRVLGAFGVPVLRGKEWRRKEISVSAGITVWVLYVPEDGSEVRSLQTWIPMEFVWDLPETDRDGTIRVSLLLRGLDARSVSARKILIRGELSALTEAEESQEIGVYLPENLPEDVQLLRRTYPMLLPKEAGEKAFALDEELTLPDGGAKLLSAVLRPEIIDQKVMSDKVVFRGAANLHTLLRTGDGELRCADFELPFSQYTDLAREYTETARATVAPAVTGMEIEEWEGRLRLKAGLVGQYRVEEQQMVECVEDAYSTRRSVEKMLAQETVPAVLDQSREAVSVATDGELAVFLDGAMLLDQPAVRSDGDGNIVTFTGTLAALGKDETGMLCWENRRWEAERTIPCDADCRVTALAAPTGKVYWQDGGRGTVALTTSTGTSRPMTMICGLELGPVEEPDPARPSLILRRTGDGGLWELAKTCGSTMEAIRSANGLEAEPEDGKLLLIPVS